MLKTVVTISDGNKVVVPDTNNVITTYVLREQEDWFEDEIHFVRRYAFNGMRSIDIGASYGLYTLALAKAAGPDGRVYAFEPTPETADCLSESIRSNSYTNVVLHRAAVTNKHGIQYLCFGQSSELNALQEQIPPGEDGIEVHGMPLDHFSIEFGDNIDFIKIDAEGEEQRIIEGGRNFFETLSPLVMYELKSGDDVINMPLIDLFNSIGYHSYRLLPTTNCLVPYDTNELPDPFLLNLFCCKEDRARQLADAGLLVMSADYEDVNGVEGAGINKWETMPFTRHYASMLLCDRKQELSSREKRCRRALDLVVLAEDDAAPLRDRLAALSKAQEILSVLCTVEPTVPRLCTHARVLAALGLKAKATAAIRKALNIGAEVSSLPKEPFFPPSPIFDMRESCDEPGGSLLSSLLEQLLKLSSFSGCFSVDQTITLCDAITATKRTTPGTERRRQLARMLKGIQTGPEPVSFLKKKSMDNLNPDYWGRCLK